MLLYNKTITVNWGDSDPFGLVYFPRMMSWFNDTEHELFRISGYPVNKMIDVDRTAFVMGKLDFEFVGPAAYGDEVTVSIRLGEITDSTMKWICEAVRTNDGAPITRGSATRVYAKILEDGSLKSKKIPNTILEALKLPLKDE